MVDIKEYLKQKRPSLSASSITTYSSILKSLHKKVFDGDFEEKDLDKTDKILDYLKDVPPNKRKTILSALVVATDNKKYREQMLEDVNAYNKEISLQKKTETQKENWVDEADIGAVFSEYKKVGDMLLKKKTHTPSELQQIQNYIILCLLSGQMGFPVRRSKDYVDFKIKGINPQTDNHLDGTTAVFVSYKTAKCYGEQRVKVPTKLMNILKKWIAINPTEYLLFDVNMNKLSNIKLNQRINKIFDGRKIGVNGLRHSVLTEKFGDMIAKKKEIEKTMSDMGSSANMLINYVKND